MRTSRNTGCHEWQANSAIHRLNRQQSSHSRARLTSQFSFSNYPAFKRAFRQNKLPDPFRFENSTFTDFCISRQLSHFAAFFIDTWPEWSTVKSIHFSIYSTVHKSMYSKQKRCLLRLAKDRFGGVVFLTHKSVRSVALKPKPRTTQTVKHRYQVACSINSKSYQATIKNDPSAGSPTETLLRLLVPPVDQVCHSSSLIF